MAPCGLCTAGGRMKNPRTVILALIAVFLGFAVAFGWLR